MASPARISSSAPFDLPSIRPLMVRMLSLKISCSRGSYSTACTATASRISQITRESEEICSSSFNVINFFREIMPAVLIGGQLGDVSRSSANRSRSAHLQLHPDSPQPLAYVFFAAAQPDSQVPFQAQIGARHHQRILPRTHPFGELHRRNRRVVLHQRDRTRLRFAPFEKSAEAGDPFPRDRQVLA